MNITDEMIARAKEAYAASVMSSPHADSMRAALAAALAQQPAEPVGFILRFGRRSDGKPWHGITTQEGIDLPNGTKLYTAPQPARVPQPVALPALPEPHEPPVFGYTSADMRAYARAALAAAGVTAADGGAK